MASPSGWWAAAVCWERVERSAWKGRVGNSEGRDHLPWRNPPDRRAFLAHSARGFGGLHAALRNRHPSVLSTPAGTFRCFRVGLDGPAPSFGESVAISAGATPAMALNGADSPGVLLKKYSLTDPLIVKLLEDVDRNNQDNLQGRIYANGAPVQNGREEWQSQFTSLTDMAGWMSASPWYKWKTKKRLPWKLFLHVSIALISMYQIVFLCFSSGQFVRNTTSLLHASMGHFGTKEVYTVQDLVTSVDSSICNVCDFSNYSIEVIDLQDPILLFVETFKDGGEIYNQSASDFSMETVTVEYNIACGSCPHPTQGTLLDFDKDADLQHIRHELRSVHLHFDLSQLSYLEKGRYCLNWDLDIGYEISLVGKNIIAPRIATKASNCGHWPTDPLRIPLVWCNIILLSLSAWSLVLTVRQLSRQAVLYYHVKREAQMLELADPLIHRIASRSHWASLPRSKRQRHLAKFFSIWVIFTACTNILQLIGSFALLLDHGKVGNLGINCVIGLAASCALLNMVSPPRISRTGGPSRVLAMPNAAPEIIASVHEASD